MHLAGVTPPPSSPSPLTPLIHLEPDGPVCVLSRQDASFSDVSISPRVEWEWLHLPVRWAAEALHIISCGVIGESPAPGVSFLWRGRLVGYLIPHSFPMCLRRFSTCGDCGLLILICEARNSILGCSYSKLVTAAQPNILTCIQAWRDFLVSQAQFELRFLLLLAGKPP